MRVDWWLLFIQTSPVHSHSLESQTQSSACVRVSGLFGVVDAVNIVAVVFGKCISCVWGYILTHIRYIYQISGTADEFDPSTCRHNVLQTDNSLAN